MKKLLSLYALFFKLGIINFGGGYALLPLLQKELVEKRGWATDDELADYYAIGQCTPGAIAVNVSTFIGYKIKGILGGIVATLGFVSPAFIIIFLIATVLNRFADYEIVQHALAGINVCVVVLVLNAIIKLAKKSIVDVFAALIAITVSLLAIITDIPLFVYVICAGLLGFYICWNKERIKKKKDSNSNTNEEVNEEESKKEDE